MRGISGAVTGAVALAATLVGGCELDITSRTGGHAEVEGVELLGENGAELGPVATLPPGGPSAVTARFLDASNRPIDLREAEHYASFRWEPAGSATSHAVEGERFTHDVRVLRPCAPPERVYVGYGHDIRADELILGPIPVQVAALVGSARAFAADSTELTPEVRLPSLTPVVVEARFYDCDGQLVEGLEEQYESLLFFSTVEFAEWERIPGEGFRHEVIVQEEAGTEGQISLGIRRVGERAYQGFGPFPLVVY